MDLRTRAFIIEAYMKKNGVIKWSNPGIEDYIKKNDIHILENQMLLIGRACIDFTVNDILLTDNNHHIYVYKFDLYGHQLDFISAGCTCGVFCSLIEQEFNVGDYLFTEI